MYIKVNYAINRVHEKAFRSDLSTQIKYTSPLTNYLLGITLFCYLFVLEQIIININKICFDTLILCIYVLCIMYIDIMYIYDIYII